MIIQLNSVNMDYIFPTWLFDQALYNFSLDCILKVYLCTHFADGQPNIQI